MVSGTTECQRRSLCRVLLQPMPSMASPVGTNMVVVISASLDVCHACTGHRRQTLAAQ